MESGPQGKLLLLFSSVEVSIEVLMMNLCSYHICVCVCVDPKGSGHQLYLPLGFLSSLGTTPGPSQLKKKHILFPKLTSVSLDWPLHFFEKKMALDSWDSLKNMSN